MLIHNAQVTGSLILNGIDIGDITGSEVSIGALNSFSASINVYTGSNNININALQTFSSSILTYTASNDTTNNTQNNRLSSLETTSGSLLTASGSFSTRVSNTETTSSNLTTASSSFSTRVANNESTGSSLVAASASFSTRVTNNESNISSLTTASGSFSTRTTNLETASGSFSTRVTNAESSITSLNSKTGSYATTSSNAFSGSQIITGSLTVTGAITAQTLNVQQVTSSIVYSSGSNIFGNSISNTQQFTGSLQVSSSASYILGNVGIGTVSPAYKLDVQGTGNFTGNINGTSTSFSSYMSAGSIVAADPGAAYYSWNNRIGSGLAVVGTLMTSGSLSVTGSSTFSSDVTTNGALRVIGQQSLSNYGGTGLSLDFTSGNVGRIVAVKTTSGGSTLELHTYNNAGSDVNALVINSNGNVGVGTTSPSYKLEVDGPAAFGTTTRTEIGNAASTPPSASVSYGMFHNTGIGLGIASGAGGSTQGIAFWNISGSTWFRSMTITGLTGNVGIGTTSPSQKLDVAGNIRTTADILLTNGGIGQDIIWGATDTDYASIKCVSPGAQDVELAFHTTTAAGTDGTPERMRITHDGNVGIGTTSPTDPLTIYGGQTGLSINSTTTGDGYVRFRKDGAIKADAYLDRTTEDFYIGTSVGSGAIQLKTLATTRVYIKTDGNVGIGTTSPSAKLHVSQGNFILSNTYGIFLNDNDGNWKIYKSSVADFTRSLVTSASININAHVGGGEGFAIGANGGNSYYEVLGSGPSHFFRGNVGVGNVASGYTLDVNGTLRTTSTAIFSGNVGIGTTSPSNILTVVGGAASPVVLNLSNANSNCDIIMTSGAGGGLVRLRNSVDDFQIHTNGSLRLIVASGGNVGIGTTSVSSKLTVYEGDVRLYKNHIESDSATWKANINFTDEVDRLGARITGERTAWGGAPMGLGFDTGAVGTVTRRMTITTDGNIGIGTTTPTTKLTINNSANANTNHIDFIGYSSVPKGHIGYFSDGLYLTSNYYYAGGQNNDTSSYGQASILVAAGTTTTSTISFALSDAGATSPSTKMMILSNGNVGIGTTSPSAKLHVVGGDSTQLKVEGAEADLWLVSNGGGAGTWRLLGSTGNTTKRFRLYDADNARDAFNIYANGDPIFPFGNVGIGTTAPGYKLDVVGDVFINGSYSLKSSTNGNIFLKSVTSEANSWIYQEASADWGMFAVNNNTQLNALGGMFAGSGLTTFITATAATGVNLSSTTGGGSSYGSIAFVHDAGNAYFAGNVGIGTTSPAYKLDVNGNIRATRLYIQDGGNATDPMIRNESYTSTGIFFPAANTFAISTNAAEKIRITSGGNVGINTTSPTVKFHVNDDSHSRLAMRIEAPAVANNAGRWTGIGLSGEEANTKGGILFESMGSSYSRGKIHIAINNAQDQTNVTTADAILTVIPAGSVGIGTTSPAGKFEIKSAAQNYVTSPAITFTDNSGVSDSRWILGNIATTYGAFNLAEAANASSTTYTPRLTILPGGNVGIGTTSPGFKLDVSGNAAISGNVSIGTTYNGFPLNVNGTTYIIGGQLYLNVDYKVQNTSDNSSIQFSNDVLNIKGSMVPIANGTQNLGSSSYRWGTVFTSDLSLSNGIGDYTIVEGENDLFLYNNKQNKVYKFVVEEVDPSTATPKKS